MRALYGVRYTDMCAFRAIRRSSLEALALREMTYGWNIEMQMQAARCGLRILEIAVPYRCRAGGESKVAGSLRGTLRAGWRIVTNLRPCGFLAEACRFAMMHGLAALCLLAAIIPVQAQANDPKAVVGVWWTQDKDGVVQIIPCGSGLCGSVVGVTDFSTDGSAPKDLHGRSRCHLQIIPDGKVEADGTWDSHITNPDDGKVYTITLRSTRMAVSACGGISVSHFLDEPCFGPASTDV